MTRRVAPKDLEDLTREWDAIAAKRRMQIDEGDDVSFHDVLVPTLLSALETAQPESVLDVGCGTGAFTELLAGRFQHVVGLDPSPRSIRYARASATRATFVISSVENYAKSGKSFAAITANMAMMNAPDIFSATAAVARLCQPGGTYAFTITHPWFWPVYWDYQNEDWFEYSDEIFIESIFRTSTMSSGMITTHIHRPLEKYIEAAKRAGFRVTQLKELMPSAEIQGKYPVPWKFPRFLLIVCIKP